jgi:hypothetical protein
MCLSGVTHAPGLLLSRDWSPLIARGDCSAPPSSDLCFNVPSAKALPRVHLIMRPTAQPDVVDRRLAQLCPWLNVVELEERASLTSSPVFRHERALSAVPQIHSTPHHCGNRPTALAPFREAPSDPRDCACARADQRSFAFRRRRLPAQLRLALMIYHK